MLNVNKNELLEAGTLYGNLTYRWNPHMKPYIFKKNGKFHILDLQKIINSCQKLTDYIKGLIEKRKNILFLATKEKAREIMKEQAIKCDSSYIVNKWKGGFLTNFGEIRKKLSELQYLNYFLQQDSFKSLIKKEQVRLTKRRDKLNSIYEGVVNLRRKPGALFIIGLSKEKTAFREAKKIGIPVIAVCNTNCNPQTVDYVIPGNDESSKSINYFANLVANTILEIKGKKEGNIPSPEKEVTNGNFE